jgi:hypothetical protein
MLLVTALAALAIPAAYVQAASGASKASCLTSSKRDPLAFTNAKTLDTKAIVRGLGLTPEQVREVRARLASYGGPRRFTLDGIGLTPYQIREINRRIAAQPSGVELSVGGDSSCWP